MGSPPRGRAYGRKNAIVRQIYAVSALQEVTQGKMTYDEMKKMLDGLKQKKRLLRSVQRQIEETREQIDCLNGRDYGGTAVQGGVKEPAAERFVEHLGRLEKRYAELMTEVFAAEDYISEHLPALSEIEQAIIIDRYMGNKSWRRIQQEYHYEERQPYNILKKAIEKLAKAKRVQ